MSIKYAILNPAIGLYEYAETIEQATEIAAKTALDFYLVHVHNSIMSVVEVLDDGSENWKNSSGEPILSIDQIKEKIRMRIEKTPGVLPVTKV